MSHTHLTSYKVHLLFYHTHIINSNINISMEQPVRKWMGWCKKETVALFLFQYCIVSLFKMCLLLILLTLRRLSRWFRLKLDTWRFLFVCVYYVVSSKNAEVSQSTKRKVCFLSWLQWLTPALFLIFQTHLL